MLLDAIITQPFICLVFPGGRDMPFPSLHLVDPAQSLVAPELQTSDVDPDSTLVPETVQRAVSPAITFDPPHLCGGVQLAFVDVCLFVCGTNTLVQQTR